jgi:hypothetical protein
MSITKMPGMVACIGAVVVASESSDPEALLTQLSQLGEKSQ